VQDSSALDRWADALRSAAAAKGYSPASFDLVAIELPEFPGTSWVGKADKGERVGGAEGG